MNPSEGAGVWFGMLAFWCLAIGLAVVLYRALWRFIRAQERIASALESIAAKQ